jgi:hypothetical protein
MGILAPGSAHARPSAQPPINMSGNFPAHMSGVGGGLNFQKFFQSIFSPNQEILSTFLFLHFFLKRKEKVVIMFAWHLQK